MIKRFFDVSTRLAVLLAALAWAPHAAANSGLLVTNLGGGKWQVNLQSQDVIRNFNGVFESTSPVISYSGGKVETHDTVELLAPNKLATDLTVWPDGNDQVNFSVSSGSGVCLRSATSDKQTVYLGSSFASATVTTTPVDLTGSGACGLVQPPTARKLHRGHYIVLLRKQDSLTIMNNSLYAGIKGFVKRYTWRDLEPAKGSYAFADVAADLDFVRSQGLQYILMIEDKTFVDENPLPDYMAGYVRRNNPGGYTAVRWDPYVVARLNALTAALGQRFDANPAFQGIALQESAPGLSGATLDATGYTPEKYRDALINVLISSSRSMPTSRMFWYMNFIPQGQDYIAEVAEAVRSYGLVMGGPDIMPDDEALQDRAYPFYRQFRDKMPLFGQVEPPMCYAHPHKTAGYTTRFWTMPELFAFGRDDLGLSFMFWVRSTSREYPDSYTVNDALPVIERNPYPWR